MEREEIKHKAQQVRAQDVILENEGNTRVFSEAHSA